jgi:adenosine kinase
MKIILSGSLAIDQIMSFSGSFSELIQKDHLDKISFSVLVEKLTRSNGGIAGNIAYSLAALGEKPVLLVSAGKDAEAYIDKLNKIGVDTSLVHFSQLPTATFSVLNDGKENQIGGFYEGAMSDADSLNFSQFATEKENIFAVISAHNPQAMARQVQECQTFAIKLLYDPGQQITNLAANDLAAGIEAASILILNEYEMSLLAQKINLRAEEIIAKTDLCIITLGKNGAKFYEKSNNHQEQLISGVKLGKVLDPTGAGDAFRAGFLYAYAHAWKTATAVELACIVASFAVQENGTQNHQLDWSKIKQRYEETYDKRLQN